MYLWLSRTTYSILRYSRLFICKNTYVYKHGEHLAIDMQPLSLVRAGQAMVKEPGRRSFRISSLLREANPLRP